MIRRPPLNKWNFVFSTMPIHSHFKGTSILFGFFKILKEPDECSSLSKDELKGFLIRKNFSFPLPTINIQIPKVEERKK